MSTNQKTSKSILASVASHEQQLLVQLETSVTDARETIERARVLARQCGQDAESTLNEDMASIRRTRETAREEEFQMTVSDADARLEGVREAAAVKVDAVAQGVLDLFLPKTTVGN